MCGGCNSHPVSSYPVVGRLVTVSSNHGNWSKASKPVASAQIGNNADNRTMTYTTIIITTTANTTTATYHYLF